MSNLLYHNSIMNQGDNRHLGYAGAQAYADKLFQVITEAGSRIGTRTTLHGAITLSPWGVNGNFGVVAMTTPSLPNGTNSPTMYFVPNAAPDAPYPFSISTAAGGSNWFYISYAASAGGPLKAFGHGGITLEPYGANLLLTPSNGITQIVGQLGIGDAAVTPVTTTLVDMTSTHGVRIPQMTGAAAQAISSPATGLMVWVTDTSGTSPFGTVGLYIYNGSAWTLH
jgi:hypothetical protein